MQILVVDDHALIREAMRGVLRELKHDAIVLEAANAADALALAEERRPDLVLLDVRLPDRSGFELLDLLQKRLPGTGVVMLSGDADRGTVNRALAEGALGFIPKTDSRDVLLGALGLVLAGGVYVPREALSRQLGAHPPTVQDAQPPFATPASLGLTQRQLDVLALMMQGKSNKLICRALDLAEPTVKNHVSAILRALGVNTRTEAVLKVATLDWDLPKLP